MIRLLTAILILTTFYGCHPLKKAEKQVNKAYVNYPDMVAEKTRQWFPLIPTTTKTDTIYRPAADSSDYYKSKTDSLLLVKRGIKDSLAIRYKDSCRSVQDNYSKGFDLGYEVGVYDGRTQCIPDTIEIPTTQYIKDSADIRLLATRNINLLDEVKELTRKNKVKGKWNLILAGFGLLALVVIWLMYKVGSKKSAK